GIARDLRRCRRDYATARDALAPAASAGSLAARLRAPRTRLRAPRTRLRAPRTRLRAARTQLDASRPGVDDVCAMLHEQRAQDRAMTPILPLAVAADGEVGVMGESREDFQQPLSLRRAHLAAIALRVSGPAGIGPRT